MVRQHCLVYFLSRHFFSPCLCFMMSFSDTIHLLRYSRVGMVASIIVRCQPPRARAGSDAIRDCSLRLVVSCHKPLRWPSGTSPAQHDVYESLFATPRDAGTRNMAALKPGHLYPTRDGESRPGTDWQLSLESVVGTKSMGRVRNHPHQWVEGDLKRGTAPPGLVGLKMQPRHPLPGCI